MSKDVFYFPHDYNSRRDPKIVAMISVHGMQGYGWYWTIIEVLREQADYRYSIKGKYAMNSLSAEMRCTPEEAVEFVDDCVNEFDLLSSDENNLWCTTLDKKMAPLDARRDRAKKAAEKRWGDKAVDSDKAEEPPKPPKVVEPEKDKSMKVLTDEKRWKFFLKELRASGKYDSLSDAVIEEQRERCINWLKANAKRYKDYRAMFRNWLGSHMKRNENTKPAGGMIF